MADMQVAMRLTLADLASGPLGQFTAKLEQLQSLASNITAKFNAVEKSIGAAGATSEKSAGGLDGLQKVVSSLSTGLAGLEAKLASATEAFTGLGRGATTAATAIESSTGKIDAANVSIGSLTKNVGGLNGALKGMAELWGAVKIEEGLKASVKAAADMQTQMAAMRSAGFSQDEANYARDWSERYAQKFPYASSNDIMAGRRAFIQATGQNNELSINEVLPQVLKNAFAVSNITKASIEDVMKNMFGVAEARGLSMTPEGILKASNLATRITEASQGRMGLSQQEAVLRQGKFGTDILSSDTGIANTMAFAEQFLSAGGGGGGRGISQASTAVTQVLKMMLGGKMNKVTAALFQQMGLMEGGGEIGGTTTTSMNTLRHIKGTTKGETDPIGWLMDVLAPAMTAYVGKHPKEYGESKTSEGLMRALDRLAIQLFGPTGGVNVGNLAFTAANPGTAARINEQRNRIQSSAMGDAAMNIYGNTQAGQVKAFDAALKDLETSFGQTLLPIVTKVMEALTGFLQMLNGLALQFPHLTEGVGIAAGALTAFLAIKGFSSLIGGVSRLISWFGKIGPAATAAAAESDAAAAATNKGWLAAAQGIGATLLKLAGTFAAVFTFGFAIRNIQIAGEGIQHYLEQLMLAIEGGFDGLWNKLSQGVMGFAQKLEQQTANLDKSVGLTSLSNYFGRTAAWIGNQKQAQQKAYQSRDDVRADMFKYESSPQAQSDDYMKQALQAIGLFPKDTQTASRAPHGAPNAQAQQTQALLDAAARASMPGGLVTGGGGVGKSEFRRIQEMIKEQSEKDDGNPYGAMMLKYQRYADILRKGGDSATADTALKVGGQAANKAAYDYENQKLEQLKQELEAQKKLNEAKQQAGQITKEQQQADNVAAAKRLGPQMQMVANAAAGYARSMGNTSDAEMMTAQGMSFGQLGATAQHAADKADYDAAMQKLEELQRTVQALEHANQEKYRGSQMSHDQMVNANNATEKQFQPQMEATAQAAEQYASALNDPELLASLDAQIAKIQQMGQQLTQTQEQLIQVAQNIENSVGSSFSSFFSSLMKGNQTWKTMLANLNNSLLGGFNKDISGYLGQQVEGALFGDTSKGNGGQGGASSGLLSGVMKAIFGGGQGASSSGGGSWMSSVGSWFSQMFGGGSASSTGSSGSNSAFLTTAASLFGDIASFAVGTDSVPHDMVAQIHAGERIIPAATNQALTEQIRNGGLGGGHQINLSIHAMDSQSVLGAMDGVKRELALMLQNTQYQYNMGTR